MPNDSGSEWVQAFSGADLWEGEARTVELRREQVLLARLLGGGVRAYQGICPHQETLLALGEFDWDAGIVTCAAHHWQFRLEDGTGVNPDNCRLFRYEVRLDGDTINLGFPDGRPPRERPR